jgi:hypothetical protein
MYYVRVKTRSSGAKAKGTPRQAVAYITDGHDARRDPGYSDAEVRYIARMGDGWKTDAEGGRVPLHGLGVLEGRHDEAELAGRFDEACVAVHDKRAVTGYLSFTFTLPKEVSLFAEGHRAEATEGIHAAVRSALGKAFGGLDFTGVAAVHTRNEAGEIHYHAHVLVSKFARDQATGKVFSLGNPDIGRLSRPHLRALKEGWRDEVNREFRDRLGLVVEQSKPNGPVALVTPEGVRLDPLNRNSRRVLEKEISPRYAVAGPSGAATQRVFKFQAMDERIFEVAAGDKGRSGWSSEAFRELFPENAKFSDRYERRVETLKQIGYLTPEGQIAPPFRVHYALRHGILTPELQRIRVDLARQVAREERAPAPPVSPRRPSRLGRAAPDRARAEVPGSGDGRGAPAVATAENVARDARAPKQAPTPTDFWAQIQRYENLRRRVERLGLGRDVVDQIRAAAECSKPTPERLREALRAAGVPPPSPRRPHPQVLIRGFVPPQPRRGRGVVSANAGPVRQQDTTSERTLEDDVRSFAKSFFVVGTLPGRARAVSQQVTRVHAGQIPLRPPARDSEPTPRFRPLFSAETARLPRDPRSAEKLVERCTRLAGADEFRALRRQEIARVYREWREAFIGRPLEELRRQAAALERPEQQKDRPRVEAARAKIAIGDVDRATALFEVGIAVMQTERPQDAAQLSRWAGRHRELVGEVLATAKTPEAAVLPKEEYQAALKAGRIGHLVSVAAEAPALVVPAGMEDLRKNIQVIDARLKAFGLENPLRGPALVAAPPAELRKAVEAFRGAGLLAEGHEWTLRAADARRAAAAVGPALDRAREGESQLLGRLGNGRTP